MPVYNGLTGQIDPRWKEIKSVTSDVKIADKIVSFNEVITIDHAIFAILLELDDNKEYNNFDYNIKYIGFKSYDVYSELLHNPDIITKLYKFDTFDSLSINVDYFINKILAYDDLEHCNIKNTEVNMVTTFDIADQNDVFGFVVL